MIYKNKNIITLMVYLLASYLSLSAEVIILKRTNTGGLVAMNIESDEDRKDYIGTPSSSNGLSSGIFGIVTKYQWPTNLLFADEMTEKERDELFASINGAEIAFINKKLKDAYSKQSYQAIYVPNTIYQLSAVAYYVEHLQADEPVSGTLKELASVMSAYFSTFYFEQDPETSERNVDLPPTFKEFLETCKKPYTDQNQLLAQVSFLINCELGKKIQSAGPLTADIWKSIAAGYITNILTHQENFNLLPAPDKDFQSDDRMDYTRFKKELDGEKLKPGGIISNLIDAEIETNKTNQALMLNASKAFPQPIGIYTEGQANRNVLTSTLRFSTLAELTADQPVPHATSYGLFPLNGAFYCKYDMPYNFASESGDYFAAEAYFYALKINKGEYYKTRCDKLFIIPPFSALAQLFGLDSMYHALTTVALKIIPDGRIEIDGFENVHDTAGILLIEGDPIDHAQRSAYFAAHNSMLLKVPQNKTRQDGLQLLENFAQASAFYSTFADLSATTKKIQDMGDLETSYKSLSSDAQKQFAVTVQKAIMQYLALAKEPQYTYPTHEYLNMVKKLKSIPGLELSSSTEKYIQSIANKIYDRSMSGLKFALNAQISAHKIESLRATIKALNGLVSKKQSLALTSLLTNLEEHIRTQNTELTSQAMPVASIWLDIAAGASPSAADKKASFITDCTSLTEENAKIKPHDDSKFRITTYNVHYWMDPYEKNSLEGILDTIRNINANVLILQEASFSKNDLSIWKNALPEYLYGWEFLGDTNNPPSDQFFGNLIISKHPFESEPVVTSFSKNYNNEIIRCFINAKIKLPNEKIISIYGTHLDVFDSTEAIRMEQIKELTAKANVDSSDYVLIAGDLNSIRKEDYQNPPILWNLVVEENAKRGVPTPTLVLDHLKAEGFIDCFTAKGKPSPSFTSWAGTAIDFIMFKTGLKLPTIDDCAIYYNAESDHIPVLVDIDISK